MAINGPAPLPKTVLITGATGDFGRAFARRFAGAGCKLVLAGRNPEKLEALDSDIKGNSHLGIAEMSDSASIKTFLETIPPEFQEIDLLINNAGLALGLEPAPKAQLEDWETMIDVNVKGLVTMTRLVLEGMAARKRGHIINIGSTAGNYPYPGGNVYCASKAFVKMFSLAIRADLAGTNIRVTNIEPGMVETQFSAVRFKGDETKAAEVYAGTTPLTPADVAESVFWAATLPPHVNINRIELMPTAQSFSALAVERFA
jgi:3-hydroxy acid dehydrogenase/malonic semialdehyde reductase